MTNKTCGYLLLFGLIISFASSGSESSVPLSTVNCTHDMKKIKCVGVETDNNTVISTVNNILMSPNGSSISEVHVESPNLQTGAEIWFPNATIKKLTIIDSNLTDIPELALSNLNELINLTVTKNSLVYIPGKSLHHLSTLKILILSYNKIQNIYMGDLKNLSALAYLSLSHNRITSIEDGSFSFLINLSTLILDCNMLQSLKKGVFTGLKHLMSLDLSDNNLLNLPEDAFNDLAGLKVFIANDNNFTLLENVKIVLPFLEAFYLKNSSINGPLKPGILGGLPNLKKLFLSYNPIGTVSAFAFSNLRELIKLNLDSCELVSLDEMAFHNLTRLLNLDLSNNMLKKLTCKHTLYLESLKEINLKENELKTIEAGAFYYSNSLQHIDLDGNMLTCNCELESFANLLKTRSLDLDEVDCGNGVSLDVSFAVMKCANNTNVCTKDKEVTSWQNASSTVSKPSFTIQFEEVRQYPKQIEANYFIIKNGNFSLKNFSCKIVTSSEHENYFNYIDNCEIDNNEEQFISIDAEEIGKYNVCVSINYNDEIYYVECLITEYNLTETTNDVNEETQTSSSTSTIHNPFKTTTHVTTLRTTVEDSSSQSSTPVSEPSTINYTFKTTTSATTLMTTTEDISSHSTTVLEASTINNTFKTTTSSTTLMTTVEDVSSPSTSVSKTTATDSTSVIISNPETSTNTTEFSETASVSSTYFPTMQTKASSITTSTTQEYTTVSTTITFSNNVTKPSQKSPSVKSFSVYKDARARLWFSWNMTSEHPKAECKLEFSILIHNQSRDNWHTECRNGAHFLGDLNFAHPYQICVDTYLQEKLIDTNCIEISPSFVLPVSASSKSSGVSEKLPAAAFIALVILAVVILILIIIVLIKLVYLRRNRVNTYDVAKEEEDNQNQIIKRSSNLYSVSSVEDDQV